MNEADEKKLYALMSVSEDQQKAVQRLIDRAEAAGRALEVERDAQALQRRELPELVQQAIKDCVAEQAGAALTEVVASTAQGIGVLNERVAAVGGHVGQLDARARDLSVWAGSRLAIWGLTVVMVLIVFAWMSGEAVILWDRSTINANRAEKAQLQREITEMRSVRDQLAALGGKAQLSTCGDQKRPCIRVVDEATVYGEKPGQFRVFWGY